MENLLQVFLDAGLLKGIEDNEQFKYLKAAAQDLFAKAAKNRVELIPFTLIALDPEVPEDEPLLERVESAIKKHWQPFKNKFPSRPVQILRAVILEALRLKTAKDDTAAAIVWLTGANYYHHKTYPTGEEAFLKDYLRGLAKRLEEKSEAHWVVSKSFSGADDSATAFSLQDVSQEQLQGRLLNASSPTQDSQGNAIKGSNTHLPSEGGVWAADFSRIAAAGIAKSINDNNTQIKNGIKDVIQEIVTSIAVLNRRYDLLWWRHSLYSPSLKSSYRGLDVSTICLFTSLDVYRLVPEQYPQSVEFLLRETVSTLLPPANEPSSHQLSLLEFLESVPTSSHLEVLRESYKAKVLEGDGRVSLLDLVKAGLIGEVPSPQAIKSRLGLASDLTIDIAELTVWLLRGLQAQHLAEQRINTNA
jgi:hypothetical protein